MHQAVTLYILNLCNAICQLCLNKAKGRAGGKNHVGSFSNLSVPRSQTQRVWFPWPRVRSGLPVFKLNSCLVPTFLYLLPPLSSSWGPGSSKPVGHSQRGTWFLSSEADSQSQQAISQGDASLVPLRNKPWAASPSTPSMELITGRMTVQDASLADCRLVRPNQEQGQQRWGPQQGASAHWPLLSWLALKPLSRFGKDVDQGATRAGGRLLGWERESCGARGGSLSCELWQSSKPRCWRLLELLVFKF